jgi:hypothetical protein
VRKVRILYDTHERRWDAGRVSDMGGLGCPLVGASEERARTKAGEDTVVQGAVHTLTQGTTKETYHEDTASLAADMGGDGGDDSGVTGVPGRGVDAE